MARRTPAPPGPSHGIQARFAPGSEIREILALDASEALAGLGIAAQAPPPVAVPAARITGKAITYDAIIDQMLANPLRTQRELARLVGYTESWFSRLIASDSFQTRLAFRIDRDVTPEQQEAIRLRFASIEEEAKGILLASLRKLSERLEDPAGVPDQLLIENVKVTQRLLGYGARPENPAPRVEMHLHLERLANNLRTLDRAPVASDAEIVEKPA